MEGNRDWDICRNTRSANGSVRCTNLVNRVNTFSGRDDSVIPFLKENVPAVDAYLQHDFITLHDNSCHHEHVL